jgi:hypothetical protein
MRINSTAGRMSMRSACGTTVRRAVSRYSSSSKHILTSCVTSLKLPGGGCWCDIASRTPHHLVALPYRQRALLYRVRRVRCSSGGWWRGGMLAWRQAAA